MSKLLKIVGRGMGIILEWLLIGLIFILFAIRTSSFQTFLAKKVTSYLSDEMKAKIDIRKVDIIFFDKIALDGIFIEDLEKDTLADIKSVYVTIGALNLDKKIINLNEISIEQGKIKLYRSKKNGEFNYQFLADYFSSPDASPDSEPYEINLDQIKLKQVDFRYDDKRKAYSSFGLDYNHIHLKNLYLTTSDVKIGKNGGISTYIRHLSFAEKSGFDMKSFSSRVAFGKKGLKLKYLRAVTPKTKLNVAHLNLKVDSLSQFSDFTNKVELDIELKKSLVSLSDVALFATALEGMKDKVLIEASVSRHIKDLEIAGLEMRIGKNTRLEGNFKLPDFANMEQSYFDQYINYALIDLDDVEKIRLPKSSPDKYLVLDPSIKKLNKVKITDLSMKGPYSKFVVRSKSIRTGLGSVSMDKGLVFAENKKNNSFTFKKVPESKYDVKVDSFLLGKFIDNSDIGSVSGQFFLEGEIFPDGKIDFNRLSGDVKRFDYMGYAYHNISLEEGSFKNNVFDGKMEVRDNNLAFTYDGMLDLNKKQHFKFKIDIDKAVLDKLHLVSTDSTVLESSFSVDISGTNLNNYSGTVAMNGLSYSEGPKSFAIPSMLIKMDRSPEIDVLSVNSAIGNAYVRGKVDYATIADDINNQFSSILPAIFQMKELDSKHAKSKFTYQVEIKDINEFLGVFAPGLKIAPGSVIDGSFDSYEQDFVMNVASPRISYDSIVITNLKVHQQVNDNALIAEYSVDRFALSDSMAVSQATFIARGTKDEINSELKWNPGTENETFFSWQTVVNDIDSYFFNLNPSYFVIRDHKWNIVDNSQILLAPKDIQIQNFKMERNQQYVTIDGCISEKNCDFLKLDIHDLELEDFATLFNLPVSVKGQLNAVATVSDPFRNINFNGDATIRDLYMNNQEIGDINLKGSWGKTSESLDLSGELFYKKNKTFNFDGKYYVDRPTESLDFNLDFDYTDIQFANAFMDPKVVSGIRGLIDGKLKVHGTPEAPVVEGAINLLGGNAKVEMFGVNFGFSGKVKADQYGFYIDNMPVMDEEGNTGSLVGTVFHDQFTNWNMDLFFNLEDDAYALQSGVHERLDRFLVMNTKYKEGDIYYGKAYATGTANIFGYADNLQIDVNMRTHRGTVINFPMYGVGDIEEGKFIKFKSDLAKDSTDQKIDFSGISMNLNFEVTTDAEMKIIFDEALGDEIVAHGSGDISIGVNTFGDVVMNGVYTVGDRSYYNFVYPPVKETFIIKRGGTITWTGDPVDARLNLETYTVVVTSLAEIMPNLEQTNSAQAKEVECYLNLTQTLSEPLITFDIRVPNATESDNAALNRIKSDKDELNKQFFSLLLVKKFQPIQGTLSAGGAGALSLVSGQLEDMLNSISHDVRINLDLRNAENSKEAIVGFEKEFGRLVVKTNLGVESSSTEDRSTSSFVGDVNVEYLISEDGSFRVSIFNESNDNTVIQEKNLGPFTQGAGLNYQEEFNTFDDFKIVQYFLDIFRKKKKYPIKKKRKQTKVPPLNPQEVKKPEEE
ncbi:MAG: translocation/assembly module TamB domain-containing protein [Bacteroidota bacterium]